MIHFLKKSMCYYTSITPPTEMDISKHGQGREEIGTHRCGSRRMLQPLEAAWQFMYVTWYF